MNTWHCSRHLLVLVSLTCGRNSHLVGWSELRSQNRPFCLSIAFAKCPKILRHFLKFCFLKIFGFIVADFTRFSYVWFETSHVTDCSRRCYTWFQCILSLISRGSDCEFFAPQVRRLLKHCTGQIYFFFICIQRHTFHLLIFLWTDTKLIVNLELGEKFTSWKNLRVSW